MPSCIIEHEQTIMDSLGEKVSADTGEETKIWSTLLQEVRRQADAKKLPANRSVLVLGDDETGKTTLIAQMAHRDPPKKGSGLEYNFVEIRDEYRDDSTKLGAWILHGDIKNARMLNFALKESNFENSCCLLVATMSQPWNIMRSLETWARVLEDHIESLQMKPAKLKQCRQQLMLKFLNYVAPSDEAESKLVASLNQANTDLFVSRNASAANGSNQGADDDNDKNINESMTSVKELGRDALSRNLGIDIVVVITKTDYISTLEKDHDYTEEYFDFIQQAIRKFCLQFGAALFYVSAKVDVNCDLLHKYLAHRIYDLPFKAKACMNIRDAIFVPSGWDNEKKISILYDNIISVSPETEYEKFIQGPTNIGPTGGDTEITCEDDQEFLRRMQRFLLSKQAPPTATLPNAPSPVQARQSLTSGPKEAQQTRPTPSGEMAIHEFFSTLISKDKPMTNLSPGPPES